MRMFVVIMVTLLVPFKGNAETSDSLTDGRRFLLEQPFRFNNFIDVDLTAEAGLCVLIPSKVCMNDLHGLQSIVWIKCEPHNPKCVDASIIFNSGGSMRALPEYRGRVSMMESDLRLNNCSIIINDLTKSDSGSYRMDIGRQWFDKRTEFYRRQVLSVTDLRQKPTIMIPPLTEGQRATLTCTAPGRCSGSQPNITWMWGAPGGLDSHITGYVTSFKTEKVTAVTQKHSSTLTFDPSVTQHSGIQVTCKVIFKNDIRTQETATLCVNFQPGSSTILHWAIAAVSLIMHVICIICILFLWKARKKMKTDQEERTYMTLQKTEESQEYEVIRRPRA